MSRLLILCAALALASCSTYKMDLPQGNIVTADMVARLKAGMTRAQVRTLLGPPLLVDPFRTDRWDYIHRSRVKGELKEQTTLTLWFADDQLLRWEGTPQATGPQNAAPVATPAAVQPPAVQP